MRWPSIRGHHRCTPRVILLALAATVVAAPVVAAPVGTAHAVTHARGATGAAPQAGFTAAPEELQSTSSLPPWSVATDDAGTRYIAALIKINEWELDLYVLAPGEDVRGYVTYLSLPPQDNSPVEVVTSGAGAATLVWLADSGNGSVVQTRTFSSGRVFPVTTSDIVSSSSSRLLDARLGPDQKIWTVISTGRSLKGDEVVVRDGDQPQGVVLATPDTGVEARLSFDGDGRGVLATVGSTTASSPVSYAVQASRGGDWSAFSELPHTGRIGQAFGLVGGSRGVRLVASSDRTPGHPVISSLSGSGFAPAVAYGDTAACPPETHDLTSDASGRVADVSAACNQLRLADLPDAAHAGYVDLPSGGTMYGSPQLTTSPDGSGLVVWAVTQGANGYKLFYAPVLLPAAVTDETRRSPAGALTVTGPRSCLPPVAVRVGASAHAAHGWHAGPTSLRLGTALLSGNVLDGSTLVPGQTYDLRASGTFTHRITRHHHPHLVKRRATTSLTFTACGSIPAT